LIEASATRLAARLAARELTARAVVEAHLERIRERDPTIRAWTVIDADAALERARILDDGPIVGPLHGLPVGVKDVIDTARFVTEYGSPIYRGHRPPADADCVAAAERAGAIVLGKTATTEFATFQPTATRNPRNYAHTPGGSSSGSAAAVADFMVPLALGTQTFGSVIRPASYCGIVGYKPTFGTIPRTGVKTLAESLDTVGVFARTVHDAALFVGALTGSASLLSLPDIVEPPWIGICRTPNWDAVEEPARAALEAAARTLAGAGALISFVELPAPFVELDAANVQIYGYELARNLAWERHAHPAALSERLVADIDAGSRVGADRYESAQRLARACREAFPDAMHGCDVLLTPSTTGEAPRGLESTGSPIMNRLWTLLHVPTVNVPAGVGPNGLPLGLQVVGRSSDDARTLAVAAWIHARLDEARADR